MGKNKKEKNVTMRDATMTLRTRNLKFENVLEDVEECEKKTQDSFSFFALRLI